MAISTSEMQQKAFNPNDHIMQIKSGYGDNESSKDYLPVQWRLVWFRSVFPFGSIETEMLHLDLESEFPEEKWEWNAEKRRKEKIMKMAPGIAIFRATVKDGQGGIATGTKSEKGVSFPDFIEKAETGAIGRALAALGYGTQFTGDEWDEAHRIVDGPVDRGQPVEPALPELAKRGQEEMAKLRARVEEIRPKNKLGVMDFGAFYANVTKKPFIGDRDVSVADRKRLNDQLDVIARMRANSSADQPQVS